MDYGYTIFKGILQGLTEFLPVSSTAHLTFTNAFFRLFGWHQMQPTPAEEEFFDIMLHLGTLLAVTYYFRSDLGKLFRVMLGKETSDPVDPGSGLPIRRIPVFLAASMVVTVVFILGMLKGTGVAMTAAGLTGPHVENLSDYFFQNPQWVAFHLMITGCLLFFTERTSQAIKRGEAGNMFTWGHALFIGLFQGIAAIFHGISRSGSTISAGLMTGLDRVTATRYSFMLSIPTFLMAAVYETLKLSDMGAIHTLNWPPMLVGMAFSAVVGYLCVKYFIQFVGRHSLVGFAIYCWAMGALMLVVLNAAGSTAAAP